MTWQDRIMDVLEKAKEPLAASELAKKLKGTPSHIATTLKMLHTEAKVVDRHGQVPPFLWTKGTGRTVSIEAASDELPRRSKRKPAPPKPPPMTVAPLELLDGSDEVTVPDPPIKTAPKGSIQAQLLEQREVEIRVLHESLKTVGAVKARILAIDSFLRAYAQT